MHDGVHHSPLTTHHSPLTTHNSQLTTHHLQARKLLKQMIDDPLSPVDETMAPALTGSGSDSVRPIAKKRKLVEAGEMWVEAGE